jgi:acyl-CoA thioester hydrolase
MFEFFYQHRVRYRECDPMGIVYHSHYLDYFEVARTEALRAFGYSYREMEDNGVIMPVVDVTIKYREGAKYDDLLDIRTVMTLSSSQTRVQFDYEVSRTAETGILVTGEVTLCFFDVARKRPIRAPQGVLDLVSRLQAGEIA